MTLGHCTTCPVCRGVLVRRGQEEEASALLEPLGLSADGGDLEARRVNASHTQAALLAMLVVLCVTLVAALVAFAALVVSPLRERPFHGDLSGWF